MLLLDEPDNYLDVPTRAWLEEQIKSCQSTILMVSHDRTLLSNVATKVICVEGSGCWVHGGSYRTLPRGAGQAPGAARRRPQTVERRGAPPVPPHEDHEAARRAVNDSNAPKADAAETRWEKFVKAGPPPPPVPDQQILVKLRGADAARRVVQLTDVSIGDLFLPFSHEIYHGERIGLIGPNGTGKTHLLNALAGTPTVANGELSGPIKFGPRTSVGMFTQVNDRPEFRGRTCLDIVRDRRFDEELAMKALARYRIGRQSRQEFETLSGGQKARLEILCLELDGHNVLLLDEPTDNLDVDSAEALEQALDGFEGTVIAVSHDRTFLAQLDRFLMITDDGEVFALPDYELAMRALAEPDKVGALRLAETSPDRRCDHTASSHQSLYWSSWPRTTRP